MRVQKIGAREGSKVVRERYRCDIGVLLSEQTEILVAKDATMYCGVTSRRGLRARPTGVRVIVNASITNISVNSGVYATLDHIENRSHGETKTTTNAVKVSPYEVQAKSS
jgi:hypothetical protein